MFDLKEKKHSDTVLLKLSTVAPQSKWYFKGDFWLVHLDASFA